jgi:hypothetical protein
MILILLAAASTRTETPRAFVERIYASYRKESFSPFDYSERLFAPKLNAAIKEDARLAHGKVGFLDGDPICSCQDTGGIRSRVVSVSGSGASAIAHVLVTWSGTTDRRDIKLNLVQTPSGWRIADVGTSDEPSLLKDLEAANRQARKH